MLKIIATAALLAATAPALAQPQGETRQAHVSYADLNLHRAADVRLFDRRLRAAAAAVCPADQRTTNVWADLEAARCRKAALAGVADQRAAALDAANATRIASIGSSAGGR